MYMYVCKEYNNYCITKCIPQYILLLTHTKLSEDLKFHRFEASFMKILSMEIIFCVNTGHDFTHKVLDI